jgi:protein TonB
MFDGLDVAQEIPARRWTAIASFTLQAALVAAALAMPLLYPIGLPEAFSTRKLFVPVSQGSMSRTHAGSVAHAGSTAAVLPVIFVNRGGAIRLNETHEDVGTVEGAPNLQSLLGGGDPNAPISKFIGSGALPTIHPTIQHVVRTSVMMEGHLAHRVSPDYPVLARQMRIEGPVLIKAIIRRQGTIEMAQIISGHPLLVQAALQAVRQWKYRPYILNGDPVEVETEITVNFVLQR